MEFRGKTRQDFVFRGTAHRKKFYAILRGSAPDITLFLSVHNTPNQGGMTHIKIEWKRDDFSAK